MGSAGRARIASCRMASGRASASYPRTLSVMPTCWRYGCVFSSSAPRSHRHVPGPGPDKVLRRLDGRVAAGDIGRSEGSPQSNPSVTPPPLQTVGISALRHR